METMLNVDRKHSTCNKPLLGRVTGYEPATELNECMNENFYSNILTEYTGCINSIDS